MNEAVIVSAVRTATGKFQGSLKGHSAPQLGALVVAEAVRRAGVDPDAVDECIMGNVVSAGLGQNPARQAALHGGLSNHVAAVTINKVCGSGLKAVMLAAQGVATGDIEIAVAGGMESMSNCPYLLPKAREGARLGNGAAGRLDDERRPVVRVRGLSHGQRRRGGRRAVLGDARGAGRVRSCAATGRRPPPRRTARSRTRSCRCHCRSATGASRCSTATRRFAPTPPPRRCARSSPPSGRTAR